MSQRADEVIFEFVSSERRPARRQATIAPPPKAKRRAAPARKADPRAFDTPNYPLVGPILERNEPRVVRGQCGQCRTRLRVKVKARGAVRVTCPICGHSRRIDL